MGAGSTRPIKDMQEVFSKTSQQHFDEHEQFIAKFLERGYKITSQDSTEDIGEGSELIQQSVITELSPPVRELPMIKLEASVIYGHYFEEKGIFDPFDDPAFKIKAFQKSSDLTRRNEPWQAVSM